MSRHSGGNSDAKVYVGDLGSNASKTELEEAFSYYGRLRSVWVARNPPGFAFVEFEDPRDAEDAVRGLDGRSVCGRRVRVELSTGRSRSRGWGGGGGGGGGGPSSRRSSRPFHPEDRCYECGDRGHYARDCPRYRRRRSSRSRSRSRSNSRSRSRSVDRRSRSRSRSRGSVDRRSKDRSRSRSSGRYARDKSGSRGRGDRSVSRSASRSRSRSRSAASPRANGDD